MPIRVLSLEIREGHYGASYVMTATFLDLLMPQLVCFCPGSPRLFTVDIIHEDQGFTYDDCNILGSFYHSICLYLSWTLPLRVDFMYGGPIYAEAADCRSPSAALSNAFKMDFETDALARFVIVESDSCLN